MKVKVEVQSQDFEGASYLNPFDCPNARAIKRVVKNIYPWVLVGGVNVSVYDNLEAHIIELPEVAKNIYNRMEIKFIDGKRVFNWKDKSAFSYELEIPEHLVKSELTYNKFMEELHNVSSSNK